MTGFILGGLAAALLLFRWMKPPAAQAGLGAPAPAGNMMTVTGPHTGRMWGVVNNPHPGPVAPGASVWDVWAIGVSPTGAVPLGGGPVLTYAQMGSDLTSRVFVSSTRAAGDPDVTAARTDFGV